MFIRHFAPAVFDAFVMSSSLVEGWGRDKKRYKGYKFKEYVLLTYKGRIYIPNVAKLRRVVMDEINQDPYSGHLGYQKTIAIARK